MNARYYVAGAGRFASADTVVPNPVNPQNLNRYAYVSNNPISFIDPSGHCGADTVSTSWHVINPYTGQLETFSATVPDEAAYKQCVSLRDDLENKYGWEVKGKWFLADVQTLMDAGQAIEKWFAAGGASNPRKMVKNVFGGTMFQYAARLSSFRLTNKHHVYGQKVVMKEHFSLEILIHELGHVLDNVMSGKTRLGGSAFWGGGLSDNFADDIGATGHRDCISNARCDGTYSAPPWHDRSSKAGDYYKYGSSEDFAQSFAVAVQHPGYLKTESLDRWQFWQGYRSFLINTYEH